MRTNSEAVRGPDGSPRVRLAGVHLRQAGSAAPADGGRLDLVLVASGATQHVLARTDGREERWLYKVPAVLDWLLPAHPVRATVSDWGVVRSLEARSRLLGSAARRVAGRGLMEVMLGWRLRRARVLAFRRMLEHLSALRRSPAAWVVAPWSARASAHARLRIDGRVLDYSGPLLRQRRAEPFFERPAGLARMRPTTLIAAHHALWRAGFAVADGAAALGPDGWGLIRGELRLCDTGSLTRELGTALRVHSDAVLDAWSAMRTSELAGTQEAGPFSAYVACVRPRVTARLLAERWPR